MCTGNLCRSPLAAALLERELADAGIEADVESAGTAAPFRRPPDRRLLRVADELGLDLSGHRSEMLTAGADRAGRPRADDDRRAPPPGRGDVPGCGDPDGAAAASGVEGAAHARPPDGRSREWAARLAADVPVAERPRIDPSNDIADPIGGPMREYRAMADEVASLVATLVARWSGR